MLFSQEYIIRYNDYFKTRMYSDFLSQVNFWGWQLIIVGAAITLPMGITTSKEYAELEWPFDIAIALIWVAFGINMIGTIIKKKRTPYICSDLVLYCHFCCRCFITYCKQYCDSSFFNKKLFCLCWCARCLVQWWYGHNAVAFS